MDLTVSGMWHSMGLMARLIVIALFVMSVLSLVITAERVMFFRKSKADSMRFASLAERLLSEGRLHEAAQQHAGKEGGYLGRTMESGLKAFVRAYGSSREYVLETVGRALEKQSQREIQNLKRGQGIVATISSTAPFVGLLGTVMGIVTSFQSMAASGSGGLGSVSGGIAEALVTTAIGLLVAIPAVFAFNWIQSWIDARAVDLAESCNELLDMVGRAIGESAHGHAQPAAAGGAPVAHAHTSEPPKYGPPPSGHPQAAPNMARAAQTAQHPSAPPAAQAPSQHPYPPYPPTQASGAPGGYNDVLGGTPGQPAPSGSPPAVAPGANKGYPYDMKLSSNGSGNR